MSVSLENPIDNLSTTLKSPLATCARHFLTSVHDQENYQIIQEPTGLVNTIVSIALPVICGLGVLFTIPLWLAGEIIEVFNEEPNEFLDEKITLRETSLDELELDPQKTKYTGFPISTYQYTSDEKFCENSDWGRYNRDVFIKPNSQDKSLQHLRFGQGIDILTDEGMKILCEDVKRVNGNTLRFSVEWADVLNKDGFFNDVAMQRYVNVAKYVESQGLKPMVVLHHFVTPLDENGENLFESEKSVDQFVDYAKYVYEKLESHVDCFLTFNEPKVQTNQNYILGLFPAKGVGNFAKCEVSTKNMLKAHSKAYDAMHALAKEKGKKITVGMTHQALRFVTFSRWNILSRVTAFALTYLFHDSFMEWASKNKDKIDILGVQYYSRPFIGGIIPTPMCEEGGKMVGGMPFRFDPKGILPVLRDVNKKLGGDIELFVSETGTPGKNYLKAENEKDQKALEEMDERRREYMLESLKATRQAQNEGLPVTGYMPWAPRRNGEWDHGFQEDTDFGLVVHDLKTLESRDTEGFKVVQKVFENTIKSQKSLEEELKVE